MSNHSPTTSITRWKDAVNQVNAALQEYSDKDWNYSRISLGYTPVICIRQPLCPRLETLDLSRNRGRPISNPIRRGEMGRTPTLPNFGMLEVVSLRINKDSSKSQATNIGNISAQWFVSLKREVLVGQPTVHAIWYRISEVAGDDFDNR